MASGGFYRLPITSDQQNTACIDYQRTLHYRKLEKKTKLSTNRQQTLSFAGGYKLLQL